MLKKIMKSLENKLKEVPEEERKEKLAKLIVVGGSAFSGLFFGTLDAVSSGLPVFTIGAPIYERIRIGEAKRYCKSASSFLNKEDLEIIKKQESKGALAYVVGAGIPFAVKYHNEIIDFAYQVSQKF